MTEIQELENKLKKAKDKEVLDKWKQVNKEFESWANWLKGKVIMRRTHNDSFFVFKVIGFKHTNWYMKSEVFKYYDLITEGHFLVREVQSYGKRGVDNTTYGDWYGSIKLKSVNKKEKFESISKIVRDESSLHDTSCTDTIELTRFLEKASKSEELPDLYNEIQNFWLFTYEFPENLYNELMEEVERQTKFTINFWDKNREILEKQGRMYNLYEKYQKSLK